MTAPAQAPVRTTEPVRLFERPMPGQVVPDYLELSPCGPSLFLLIWNGSTPDYRCACRLLDREQALRLAWELEAWAIGLQPDPTGPQP